MTAPSKPVTERPEDPFAGWHKNDQTGIPRLFCEKGHPNIYAMPEIGRVFCGTCNVFARIEGGSESRSWMVSEPEWVAAHFHEAFDEDARVIWARKYRELKGAAWVRDAGRSPPSSEGGGRP